MVRNSFASYRQLANVGLVFAGFMRACYGIFWGLSNGWQQTVRAVRSARPHGAGSQLQAGRLRVGVVWILLAGFLQPAVGETILLDFSSTTCGPCQQMRPIVRQLMLAGQQVREIDIHQQPHVAAEYCVTQVPTFVVLVNGRETGRCVGTTSLAGLQQMLARGTSLAQSPTGGIQRPEKMAVQNVRGTGSTTRPPLSSVVRGGLATAQANGINPRPELAGPPAGRIVSIQTPPAPANPSWSTPTASPPAAPAAPAEIRRLLEATVKISVDDPQGKSAGTGTIVDARSGEALILTCGHLFRSSAGQGAIAVTLFQVGYNGVQQGASYPGRLIEYDLERDLGLVSIRPQGAVPVVEIAPGSGPLPPGTTVTSVGCNGGQPPTSHSSQVTANDRYQGPSNIEVAGAPVEGRSGGGLFNQQGQLVGVCFAADPQQNEGLYASLRSVHTKLDSLGLSMIYQPSAETLAGAATPPPAAPSQALANGSDFAVRGQEPGQQPIQRPNPVRSAVATAAPALDAEEQAAWDEIQRRGMDSEVICIIRPQNPQGKSEVITLSNASPAFVGRLTGSGRAPGNTPTAQPATTAAATQLLR